MSDIIATIVCSALLTAVDIAFALLLHYAFGIVWTNALLGALLFNLNRTQIARTTSENSRARLKGLRLWMGR